MLGTLGPVLGPFLLCAPSVTKNTPMTSTAVCKMMVSRYMSLAKVYIPLFPGPSPAIAELSQTPHAQGKSIPFLKSPSIPYLCNQHHHLPHQSSNQLELILPSFCSHFTTQFVNILSASSFWQLDGNGWKSQWFKQEKIYSFFS